MSSSRPRILIVHPEPETLALLSSMLRSLGHDIDEAANDRAAARSMEHGRVEMVLAAVDPADPEALELLSYIRRKHREVPVILLFPSPNAERAREALRLGALSVLRYPVPATELRAAVTQALGEAGVIEPEPPARPLNGSTSTGYAPEPSPMAARHSADRPRACDPRPAIEPAPGRGGRAPGELGLIGLDPSLRLALEMAAALAPSRTPVMIAGEPGTGKATLARAIHALGPRADRPFVTIDGPAIARAHDDPEAEVDFDWHGKLAQARGGTLFLREVAALPDALQGLLLRALEEHALAPAPGLSAPPADVRFLFSTGENLAMLVEQAAFRQDLYHRANVVALKLPPLRHRGGDVERLADAFRARAARELGKNVVGFTHDAIALLNRHEWPGNVRELQAMIHRAVGLCHGSRIASGHLAPSLAPSRSGAGAGAIRPQSSASIRPLKEALEEPEKRIIIQALQALNWNRQETARVLDINRTTLYKKMKKFGLLVDEPIWVN